MRVFPEKGKVCAWTKHSSHRVPVLSKIPTQQHQVVLAVPVADQVPGVSVWHRGERVQERPGKCEQR